MRDVSARVAAERALAQSRARLDFAVRLSGVGFWYCDLPLGELAWDARVKAHFFLAPDARVTIETFYDRIHPEDREPTRAAIDASIAQGGSYDVVYRTVDPTSGAIKWIRALGGVTYADTGPPIRFDGVTVDVTAQKLEEERLARVALENAQLNEQLREHDRRKDEFLATLAHELRNPLAPIRTGLYLLGQSPAPAQAARTRAMMERQLAHLVRLVDDLLDLSRVTLGKIELRRERLDLRTVIDSSLETTRSLLDAAGHELSVQLPERPLLLDLDPARMSQVFANLVNNAVKYTPRGGRIAITVEEESATLAVRIRDTGVGIPPEMLPRVFEMFTQLGGSQGGLGIGLTLVRRLVELHGGTVEAASAGAGHGSTFTVRLPLLVPPVPARAPARDGEPSVSGIKVLVVDDNLDAAESLAMLLELRGNQTRLAHTGPDALAAAAAFQPQVVFLDIGLPGLDGYEVAQRLRAAPLRPRPLLVAVTGWGSADDRQRARDAGFDLHLVKPVDSVAIDAALAAWPPAE
jgi:signal transduction histidine kinase